MKKLFVKHVFRFSMDLLGFQPRNAYYESNNLTTRSASFRQKAKLKCRYGFSSNGELVSHFKIIFHKTGKFKHNCREISTLWDNVYFVNTYRIIISNLFVKFVSRFSMDLLRFQTRIGYYESSILLIRPGNIWWKTRLKLIYGFS